MSLSEGDLAAKISGNKQMDPVTVITAVGSYVASLENKKIAGIVMDSLYDKVVEYVQNAMRISSAGENWENEIVKIFRNDKELIRQIQLIFDKSPVLKRAGRIKDVLSKTRILWVDDTAKDNFYEYKTFASFGVKVDFAEDLEAAVTAFVHRKYDVVISNMELAGRGSAGSELLNKIKDKMYTTKFIFYVSELEQEKTVPQGAWGITERPDELFHLVFDVLERKKQN
ncbi:MAG: response regulator [Candidatus Omnitrophica bacterium]|nr:response regulator [Candidatus Omnitrophota bacterium]